MSRKSILSIVLLISTFLFTFIPLAAQHEEGEKTKISERIVEENQTQQDSIYQEPGTALFVEFVGKPFGSMNIDIRINKSSRLSVGVVIYMLFSHHEPDSIFSGWKESEEGKDNDVGEYMPNIMYYYFVGKRNSRLEIGGGFSVRPVWNKDINGDFPLAFHGVIGYRYQKKKGFLFRAGYAPSYWPDAGFSPRSWIGLSFGYSF